MVHRHFRGSDQVVKLTYIRFCNHKVSFDSCIGTHAQITIFTRFMRNLHRRFWRSNPQSLAQDTTKIGSSRAVPQKTRVFASVTLSALKSFLFALTLNSEDVRNFVVVVVGMSTSFNQISTKSISGNQDVLMRSSADQRKCASKIGYTYSCSILNSLLDRSSVVISSKFRPLNCWSRT